MSKMQLLRAVISERLTAAAEEILGVVGRTLAEYEEELLRRQQLLDVVLNPEIKLPRADSGMNVENDELKQERLEGMGVDTAAAAAAKATVSIFNLVRVKDEDDDEDINESNRKDQHHRRRNDQAAFLSVSTTEEMRSRDAEGAGVLGPVGGYDLLTFTSEASPVTDEDEDWDEVTGVEADESTNNLGHVQTQAHGEPNQNVFICGQTFGLKRNLNCHVRAQAEQPRNPCSFRGKGFDSKTHLDRHTGKKPHTCHICNKTFTVKSTLVSHLRMHSGAYPHRCAVCGKGFRVSSYLKVHMRFHTGVRPHSCSVCGRAFQVKSNLMFHMRTHTGERPYGCTVCGKGFTRNEILKDHMNLHTGDKPYTCDVCGKCFTHRTGLIQHTKTHSADLRGFQTVAQGSQQNQC